MKTKCKWAYALVVISAVLTLAQAVLYAVLFTTYSSNRIEYMTSWFRGRLDIDLVIARFPYNYRNYPRWFFDEDIHLAFCVGVLVFAAVGCICSLLAGKSRGASIVSLIFCTLTNAAFLFLFSSLSAYTFSFLVVLNIVGNVKLLSVHAANKKAETEEITSGEKIGAADPKAVKEMQAKIEFEDTIIREKEWKAFRKGATQEELSVLAIGSKFMTNGKNFFIKALISVLGTILSIVIGLFGFKDEGMFGVVVIIGGYLFFNCMAVKLTSYTGTFQDCYKKLNQENKEYVDSFGKEKPVVAFFKGVVEVGLTFFTLPYRAILMVVETAVPSAADWCIAHGGLGGAVITLPKGYDIGGLREVGEYYKSCSFADALIESAEQGKAQRAANTTAYTYEDETGVTQTAYSDDGKNFYSSVDKTTKVGESANGGKSIDLDKKI